MEWSGGSGVGRGVTLAGLILLEVAVVAPLGAQPTEAQVQAALEFLPPAARSGAGVRTRGPDGTWVVRRPADNRWTCRVWTVPGRLVVNCHHTVLEGMLDRSAALYEDGLRGDAVLRRKSADLGIADMEPTADDPWLHYAGTAKAHLMWPREHRPAGASASGSPP